MSSIPSYQNGDSEGSSSSSSDRRDDHSDSHSPRLTPAAKYSIGALILIVAGLIWYNIVSVGQSDINRERDSAKTTTKLTELLSSSISALSHSKIKKIRLNDQTSISSSVSVSSSNHIPSEVSALMNAEAALLSASDIAEKYSVKIIESPAGVRQSPRVGFNSPLVLPDTSNSVLNAKNCDGPFPGYPYCEERINWLAANWNANPQAAAYYRSQGVDGSQCSYLTFLNLHGFWCPEAADFIKQKIRGVNIGGWFVLEPWVKPSLFDQFDPLDNVVDHWGFCETLGKVECKRQLEAHWDSFITEADIAFISSHGVNHLRVPIGYWIMGDIRQGEPWVNGELKYLDRFMGWCSKYKVNVVIDLHCAPGSQNGFDNSGKRGPILWSATHKDANGKITYPNIERTLRILDNITNHLTQTRFDGTLVAVEVINEAFLTIPIEIVKDFYVRAYEVVKKYANGDLAVIIGDSFRFGSWNGFMFPPHYRHVWIDTHIYQMFDPYHLSLSWQDHLKQTCTVDKPNVGVAPLSVLVGEWSVATNDCPKYMLGVGFGARYDGSFQGSYYIGSCDGQNDINNADVWTPAYKQFLREYAEKQMDAYESGSSAGWFFWNLKTESAPQWDYILGLKQGWIPSDHSKRIYKC